MGYSSLYIIQNFGTLCLTVFIAPVMWIISHILKRLFKGKFLDLNIKWTRLMFYDAWLTFFTETYLFLAVCSGLNMYYFFKWTTFGDAVNTLCAIFFGCMLLVFPFFVPIFFSLNLNYKRVFNNDSEFLKKFGSMLSELNFLRRGRLVLVYKSLTMCRKLWLAIIVVC